MRKLLPYEHQLVEALGVTKEDYLDFIAIQQDYKDPKAGTDLDIRNEAGTVAIVLTVVGTLFQVGAALLAPKPDIPDVGNRRQNRQQRFAPSFGFNSVQDLATYGDPVNLVYTHQNAKGSVRVNGSLVWSAIENFGSTQFMQLMLVIGASKIRKIDYNSTAIGQKLLNNFDLGSFYIFGKDDGLEGFPAFSDLQIGHQKDDFFPSRLKPSKSSDPACILGVHGNKQQGFSQAYSPTSATSIGVFDAIPINVNVLTRDKDGDDEESNILIKVTSGRQGNRWRNNAGTFRVNDEIELEFDKASRIQQDKAPGRTAGDLRRQMVDALDFSSTYLLGSSKFRLARFKDNQDIEENNVTAIFKCINAGRTPSTRHDTTEPKDSNGELKREFVNAFEILSNTRKEGVDRQLSDEGNIEDSFAITNNSDPIIDVRYDNTFRINWTPVLNLVDDEGRVVDEYDLDPKFINVSRKGSIEFSKELSQDLRDNLIISVDSTRKKLRQQKKRLKQLVDEIRNCKFDGNDLKHGDNNFDDGLNLADRAVNGQAIFVSNSDINRNIIGNGFKLDLSSYDRVIFDRPNMQQIYGGVWYTFIYIDRKRNWRYFSFNGIFNDNPESKPFPDDDKMVSKRNKVENKKKDIKNIQRDIDSLSKDLTTITSEAKAEGSSSNNKKLLNEKSDLLKSAYDQIAAANIELEEKREKVNERYLRNVGRMHELAISAIEDDIDFLESIINQLPSKNQEDVAGKKEIKKRMKALVKEKKADLEKIEDILGDWDEYKGTFDNTFFSKCLVKAEKASYETLSPIDSIKFSLKVKLFRRISGRQNKYGEETVKKFSKSDNGVKSRMVFFRMFYKKQGGTRQLVDICFAIRRGSESDFYTQIAFRQPNSELLGRSKWSFEFEPVHDVTAENSDRPFTNFAFLEESDLRVQIHTTTSGEKISWTGRTVSADRFAGNYPNEKERGPVDTNEWDMFSVNSDTNVQFSHESGPEILLTAVTEQQFSIDNLLDNKYKNVTMMSMGVYANRGLQDLRSVSALVTQGKGSHIINASNKSIGFALASTSYAPDIFVDTLLDPVNGVGKYVSQANLDIDSLALAKKFCKDNNLPEASGSSGSTQMFMDGVIADVGSWREFWINAAPFSLLELARKNGKDTLVPAVPCNSSGVAADNQGRPARVTIRALFTTGNILEGSYKEEFLDYGTSTEDLIASVIYRDYDPTESFPKNKTVTVKRSDASENAVRETFDASQFVTQREQAIMFAKLLCNQRRFVRKGIEFKTFPTEAGLEPGEFIYVDVGLKNWDKYSSGVVMADGFLNCPLAGKQDNGTRTYKFLLYNPATKDVRNLQRTVETFPGGQMQAPNLSNFEGYMFVMGQDKPDKRVFRVTELAIEEGGELSVKAVEYPCFESSGTRAHIADFRSSNFRVS